MLHCLLILKLHVATWNNSFDHIVDFSSQFNDFKFELDFDSNSDFEKLK